MGVDACPFGVRDRVGQGVGELAIGDAQDVVARAEVRRGLRREARLVVAIFPREPDRERVENVWQARLFKGEPNEYQTRFGFWETVGESLAYRNNAYVWKLTDPATYRVIEMFALHPDQVACKKGAYEVTIMEGYIDPLGRGPGKYTVDETTILHIRGHRQGVKVRPPPIKVLRMLCRR